MKEENIQLNLNEIIRQLEEQVVEITRLRNLCKHKWIRKEKWEVKKKITFLYECEKCGESFVQKVNTDCRY